MVIFLRLFCVNGEYKLVVKRTNNKFVSTGDYVNNVNKFLRYIQKQEKSYWLSYIINQYRELLECFLLFIRGTIKL